MMKGKVYLSAKHAEEKWTIPTYKLADNYFPVWCGILW